MATGSYTLDDASWLDGSSLRVGDVDGDGVFEVLVYSGPIAADAEPAARLATLGYLAAGGDLDLNGQADLL